MAGKLVLHIGTHKTGTTTLQSTLESNTDARRRAGFIYPTMPEKWEHAARNRNGYWLNMAVLERIGSIHLQQPEKIAACRAMCSELLTQSERNLILSDERLWYNGTKSGFWPAARAILEECGAREVTVVLYLRRQDLFAESLWAQFVKQGNMSSELVDYISANKIKKVCDYARGIKAIQAVFGAENLVIRIYDCNQLVEGDTVADFLSTAGIEDRSAFVRPELPRNPSLGPTATLLKLQINRSPGYREHEKDFLHVPAKAVSAQRAESKASFLTPEQRAEFLAQYDQGNEWIARECLGREDGVLFPASEDELQRPAFEPDALMLALQTCELMAEALTAEREERRRETAALRERLHALEAAQAADIGSRAKRAARKLLGR